MPRPAPAGHEWRDVVINGMATTVLARTDDGAPRHKKMPAPAISTATPADPEPAAEEPEVDVSEYHSGHGWYDIPGHDSKVRGEDAARAALRGQE